MSMYDEYSLEQMQDSVSFNKQTGHYRVALPWRYGRSKTAENFKTVDTYGMAMNRTRRLKEKFLKNPVLPLIKWMIRLPRVMPR